MRPRQEDYLITMKSQGAERQIIWNSDKELELDLPHTWLLKKLKSGELEISLPGNEKFGSGVKFADTSETKPTVLNLPLEKHKFPIRALKVEIKKLKLPRPVYTNIPAKDAIHTTDPQQLCVFYGQRYFLIHYRPVRQEYFTLKLSGLDILKYKFIPGQGYKVIGLRSDIKVNIGGHKGKLELNREYTFKDLDFFRALFIFGVHWWRFRMVPTPDSQPPIETDETEDDLLEKNRITLSSQIFLAISGSLLIILSFISMLNPEPKKVSPHVEFKKPLIVPPMEVAKIPPPPPPVKELPKEPEPPKKVVEEPKPPKTPEKKIAKAKPIKSKSLPPKKVAKAPDAKLPAKKPAPVSLPEKPDPTALAKEVARQSAAKLAAEKKAEQTQLLKSLSFLSSSPKKASVDSSQYTKKEGKFANTSSVGDTVSTTNSLSRIVAGATGDGSIKTNSSRTINSEINFGEKTKGLNNVQGKVSLSALSSAGEPGSGIGNSSGLELSGPGTISESLIEKALAKKLSRFQYCYEKALLSDASLSGDIKISWTITVNGKVQGGKVLKSAMNSKDLHTCILNVLKEVEFPKPKGGSVEASKVFNFTSSSM